MIGDFFKSFTATEAEQPQDDGARLALAALLVRVARSNWDYDDREVAQIDEILSRRYGLTNDQAQDVRHQAEKLEADANDTVQFTRAIKDAVSLEDRDGVMEALWQLVLADDDSHEEEQAILRLVAPLLGVNDRDSALARQRVQERLNQT